LGLLLHRAERSAVPACARARPDEHQDELAPEAGPLAPHRGDAARLEPNAWDASDGAHPDVAEDVARQLPPHLADAGAGKSAVPELDDPVQDAFPALLPASLAEAARDAAVVPCKPDEAQSAAQSCVAQGAAVQRQLAEAPDAAYSEPQEQPVARKQSSMAQLMLAALQRPQAVAAEPQDARVALPQPEQPSALAALQALLAFQRQAAQLQDAPQAREQPALQLELAVPVMLQALPASQPEAQ